VCNLSIKLYCIYVCYTNIMLHHVIHSVRYYLQFHVTAVGLGTYFLRIWGSACIWFFPARTVIERARVP